MAIDPTIALNVKPLQIASPFDMAGQAMQMRDLSQKVQSGQLDLDAKARAAAEAAQLRALMQQNPNATAADVAKIAGPMAGANYGKTQAEQREAELKTAKARANLTTQLLQGVDDEDSFQLALAALSSMLGPDAAAELGTTYDAARVKQVVARGIEVKDWIDAQFKAKEDTRDQERHDAEQPGVIADSAKKGTEALDAQLVNEGRLLGAATNTAEWKAALAQLPPERAKQYPAIFSKTHQRFAVKAASTAQERIDNAIKQQNANTSSFSAQTSRMVAERGPVESFQWAVDPRDGKVKMMSPQEIRASGAGQAPTADMRNKEAAKPAVQRGIQSVRKLGQSVFTKVGPAQRAEAIRRGADAVFGNDPVFRTYQDARMATASALAVEQQGARVSDMDVKALWLPMIPDAYRDTKESWDLKWALIDDMRGSSKPASASVDGPVDKVWDPITKTFKKVGG